MREILALCLIAPSVLGCVEAFGDRDAHQPGEVLGTYHLAAKQTSNSCGDGALGAGPTWEFDVQLASENDRIYWDSGGQVIAGALAGDGVTFEIATDVLMDMRTEEDAGKPPCSIARHDTATGALVRDGETVTSFSGTLSYAFAPTAESDCNDLVTSEAPVFAAIPCAMAYAFKAPRTGD
jgi:hypothetical protein